MAFENETLGALLGDQRIAPIAANAIRNRDLKAEPLWDMTLSQLKREQYFTGEIARGIERLYRAAEAGEWYFPLYSDAECAADPARDGVNVVWFPSDASGADERPFILLVPGGGFVNVWNLTEGWPIAEQFNRYGYHVFILTYQVEAVATLMEKNMEDFARALTFVRENATRFHLNGDRYITCGFSAGGYLVCLWNTQKGYPKYGLPEPRATFPIYPVVSLREGVRYVSPDLTESVRLYGCPIDEAVRTEYEIPDHAEGFPPCAIFLAAEDDLVNPENSKLLARALERLNIPCKMEIGPSGGHGFADGSGMCMAGWTERAIRWYETLDNEQEVVPMKLEALEVLKNRRAIRAYKPEQITDEALNAVLEAGTYAPTGAGTQGVQIVAVQSPEAVAEVDALNAKVLNNPTAHPYYGAPTIILIFETEKCVTHELDGAAVCTNMLNAAYAVGLGSCWIHRCKQMFELPEGKALLKKWGLPETLTGVASIALGYAACDLPKPAPRKADYIVKV